MLNPFKCESQSAYSRAISRIKYGQDIFRLAGFRKLMMNLILVVFKLDFM